MKAECNEYCGFGLKAHSGPVKVPCAWPASYNYIAISNMANRPNMHDKAGPTLSLYQEFIAIAIIPSMHTI